MSKFNLKKLVALMGVLAMLMTLVACGGGGGGGDATVTPTPTTTAAGVEVTGTVGGSTGMPSLLYSPLFQTATDNYTDANAKIEVVDEVGSTEVDLKNENANANFTGVNQFKVNIPYTTDDKTRYAVIRIKEKITNKIIFKNFIGRVPRKSEVSDEKVSVKVQNVKVNETTTAKALYAFEDKANAADFVPAIATQDINNATTKTPMEQKLEEKIANLDAKIKELTMILEAIKKILLANSTNTAVAQVQAKIDNTTTTSINNVLNGFVEIAKVTTVGTTEAQLQNAGVVFTKEVQIGGTNIGATTTTTTINTTITTIIKPAIKTPVKAPRFTPLPGPYQTTIEISIVSDTPNARIRYIVNPWDVTKPVLPPPMGPGDGVEYKGPFMVNKPVRIMAIAVPASTEINLVPSAPIVVFYDVRVPAPRVLANITLTPATATILEGTTFEAKLNVKVTAFFTNGTNAVLNNETPGLEAKFNGVPVNSPSWTQAGVYTITYTEGGVTKSANFTLTVTPKTQPPVTDDLKITELKGEKQSDGKLKLTWKTSKVTTLKAKATIWTGEVPSTTDKSFNEPAASPTTDHLLEIAAAEVPANFVKIRVAYIISEDSGTFADLLKAAITTATVTPPPTTGPITIVEAKVAKNAAGDHIITWKTSAPTTFKAKVTFWSGDVPSTTDKSISETAAPATAEHTLTMTAANMPSSFVKVRIAYIFDEENGTFKDVQKAEVTTAATTPSQAASKWKCTVCGYMTPDATVTAPAQCPVCKQTTAQNPNLWVAVQ